MNKNHFVTLFGITLILTACTQAIPSTPAITKPADSSSNPDPTQKVPPTPTQSESFYPVPLQVLTPENIKAIQHIDTIGEGIIGGVAISPDKQTLAIHTGRGIYFYESETFLKVGFIDTGFSGNTDQSPLAYSPNGNLLAYSNGIIVRIMDLMAGNYEDEYSFIINEIPGFTPTQIEFSPAGNNLLIKSEGFLRKCDGAGANFALYSIEGNFLFDRYVCTAYANHYFRFTNDDRLHLFFHTNYGVGSPLALHIVETSTGKLIESKFFDYDLYKELYGELTILEDKISYYDVSPDGTVLAYMAEGNDWIITKIVDADTGKLLETIDGVIEIEDFHDGTLTWHPRQDARFPNMLTGDICDLGGVKPSGYYIELYSFDNYKVLLYKYFGSFKSIELWDITTCEISKELAFPSALQIQFSPDGQWLFAQNRDASYIWDMTNHKINSTLQNEIMNELINHYRFSEDGTYLITGVLDIDRFYLKNTFNDYDIKIWNTKTGELVREIHPFGGALKALELSPTGEFLITRDSLGIYVWDLATGEPERKLQDGIFAFGQENTLWLGNEDQIIQFDMISGEPLQKLKHNYLFIYSIQTNDLANRIIASVKYEEYDILHLALFDALSGNLIKEVKTDYICCLWTSTDKHLITGSHFKDDHFQFWDLELDKTIQNLPAHQEFAISPDGTLLVFMEDSRVKFWDLGSGDYLGEEYINSKNGTITFSPDGRLIAITGKDGLVELWGVPAE
ncbi:MAG: hypothetical protein HND51_10460 [Chloroflexi bacterium]|nr:hypothetical protein [Chloroflexota bacterium]